MYIRVLLLSIYKTLSNQSVTTRHRTLPDNSGRVFAVYVPERPAAPSLEWKRDYRKISHKDRENQEKWEEKGEIGKLAGACTN